MHTESWCQWCCPAYRSPSRRSLRPTSPWGCSHDPTNGVPFKLVLLAPFFCYEKKPFHEGKKCWPLNQLGKCWSSTIRPRSRSIRWSRCPRPRHMRRPSQRPTIPRCPRRRSPSSSSRRWRRFSCPLKAGKTLWFVWRWKKSKVVDPNIFSPGTINKKKKKVIAKGCNPRGDRQQPVSNMAKPACMNITKVPHSNNQAESKAPPME